MARSTGAKCRENGRQVTAWDKLDCGLDRQIGPQVPNDNNPSPDTERDATDPDGRTADPGAAQTRGTARSRCAMNSSRVSLVVLNAPSTLLVTIVAPPFWTPRIARHRCSASITTPTP